MELGTPRHGTALDARVPSTGNRLTSDEHASAYFPSSTERIDWFARRSRSGMHFGRRRFSPPL
jgi:hypothetical protein